MSISDIEPVATKLQSVMVETWNYYFYLTLSPLMVLIYFRSGVSIGLIEAQAPIKSHIVHLAETL